MAEEEKVGQSRDSLFSDFERISELLRDAQNLAKQNNEFNPAILRRFFVVLKEIFKFMKPIVGSNDTVKKIEEDIKDLDQITRDSYRKLLSDREYRVPVKIFYFLDKLHLDLLILKQNANLGIRMRETLTSKKKIERAME